MENEYKARETGEENNSGAADQQETESGRRIGLPVRDVGRYIRYVIFLVAIGLFYIWNSHVAEKQVRKESKLKTEIEDAKAEYKTMHARLSAGVRRPVIMQKVDSLGLEASTRNTYKLTRD